VAFLFFWFFFCFFDPKDDGGEDDAGEWSKVEPPTPAPARPRGCRELISIMSKFFRGPCGAPWAGHVERLSRVIETEKDVQIIERRGHGKPASEILGEGLICRPRLMRFLPTLVVERWCAWIGEGDARVRGAGRGPVDGDRVGWALAAAVVDQYIAARASYGDRLRVGLSTKKRLAGFIRRRPRPRTGMR